MKRLEQLLEDYNTPQDIIDFIIENRDEIYLVLQSCRRIRYYKEGVD